MITSCAELTGAITALPIITAQRRTTRRQFIFFFFQHRLKADGWRLYMQRQCTSLTLRLGIFVTVTEERKVNEEIFNMSLRKFLKKVGVGSQNEIEKAVAQAMADKVITGNEDLPSTMTLDVAGIKLNVKFEGTITLE